MHCKKNVQSIIHDRTNLNGLSTSINKVMKTAKFKPGKINIHPLSLFLMVITYWFNVPRHFQDKGCFLDHSQTRQIFDNINRGTGR